MQAVPDQVIIQDEKPHTADGLMCFFDGNRECGADCMAYLAIPDQSPLAIQQRHCVVLVSVERLARHVAIGTKLMNETKLAEQDRQRADQKPPTPPR